MAVLGTTPRAATLLAALGGLLGLCGAAPAELKLGIFISWEGGWDVGDFVSPAVLRAIDDINGRTDILPATALKWVWHDGQCEAKFATEAMMDMKLKYDVDAFVGPPCSVSALRTVPMGAYWDLPFISWAAASPSLSDKALYPNFARVNGNYRSMNAMFMSVAKYYGWDHLAVLYADNGLWGPTADDLISRIRRDADVVLGFTKLFPDTTKNNADQSLAWMPLLKNSGTRIVVVLGYCLDMRNILLSASRLDMLEGYEYFFLDVTSGCHVVNGNQWPAGWGPGANAEAAHAFDYTLNVVGLAHTSPETSAFEAALLDDFNDGAFEPYRFPPAGTITPIDNVTVNPYGLPYEIRDADGYQTYAYAYAALLYDAIELYARSADRVIANGGDPTLSPELVAEALPEVSFTGLSGFIQLDANLDRNPDIDLQQARRVSDSRLSLSSVGAYVSKTKTFSTNPGAIIRFPGGGAEAPTSYVLRDCTSADYDYEVEGECNDDLVLEVAFVMKAGVECRDIQPEAHVRCQHLPAASPAGIAALALAAVSATLAAACAVWVVYYRLEAIVRYAQPEFCLLFLLGCVLINVSVILHVGDNTVVTCVVSPYLFHLSFTLCFTALSAKIYRVWRVFETRRVRKKKVHMTSVLQVCGLFVCVDAILLLVMSFVSPIGPEDESELTHGVGVEVAQTECGEGGHFVFMLWAIKIFLMIGTCLLSCQVRHIDGKFSESKHILVAVYEVTILSVVALLVSATSASVPLRILVQSFAASVATAGSICAIFGPKVLVHHGCADEKLMFGEKSIRGPDLKGSMSGSVTNSTLLVSIPPPPPPPGISSARSSLTASSTPGISLVSNTSSLDTHRMLLSSPSFGDARRGVRADRSSFEPSDFSRLSAGGPVPSSISATTSSKELEEEKETLDGSPIDGAREEERLMSSESKEEQ